MITFVRILGQLVYSTGKSRTMLSSQHRIIEVLIGIKRLDEHQTIMNTNHSIDFVIVIVIFCEVSYRNLVSKIV